MPSAQQASALAHLEILNDIVANLPTTKQARAKGSLPGPTGHLTPAEGAALRAIRAVIFEHDQLRAFGGLRRVQASAGDLLWACENHCPRLRPWTTRYLLRNGHAGRRARHPC